VNLKLAQLVKRFVNLPVKELNREHRYSSPVQLHDFVSLGAKFCNSASEVISNLEHLAAKESQNSTTLYPSFYDTNPRTLLLIEQLIERNRPKVVVETGIGNGLSTRTILKAFKKNKLSESKLFSIDTDPRTQYEDLVPNPQFYFKLLDKKNDFSTILKAIPKIDFFYHDSDHSYSNQKLEYNFAWKQLNRSGILLSDDINWSNGFLDFCVAQRIIPIILCDTEKYSGLVCKH
jgi:hypothetical protein